MVWTENDIKWSTMMSTKLREGTAKRVEQCATDAKVGQRRAMHQCRACFYHRRAAAIAGRAFTGYKCQHCSRNFQHPNTDTPKLCQECADKLGLCVTCGGVREE